MSDLQGSNSATKAPSMPALIKSVHEQRVINVIPAAIKNASRATLESMLDHQPKMPDWYMQTSSADRQRLKTLMDERWRLQGELDSELVDLQHDIEAFARPLLAAAIKATFSHLGDPETLSLQLYVPNTIIFGIDTGASRLRRSSLLAAALHNFEAPETQAGAFRSGSGVFRDDPQGHPQRVAAITVQALAEMCRTLDIGGQYQRHIQARLQPQKADAEQALQHRSVACEQSAFRLAALMAHLKGDISTPAYESLQNIVEGSGKPTLQGRPLLNHRLSLMGFKLTGIVVFSAVSEPSEIKKLIEDLTPQSLKFWLDWSRRIPVLSGNAYEKYKLLQNFFANGPQGVIDEALHKEDIYNQSRLNGPLIAYVPDDPHSPLKEYASLGDFMNSLLSRLRHADYQEFFSRFVDQKDKGKFFSRANERLKTVTWHQREPLDAGPWWRETAIENPNAEPITNLITDELWGTLSRKRRRKAIADARLIAVPTDDEDATTRWKRLTSALDIAWNLFNFGAMLVPGLGEVMLGVMVAQMLADLAEGIEDWSQGDKEQAAAFINGSLINFAQLALMGAGHLLPAKVVPVKVSPFVEQLKPVQVNGVERLWNADLSPYEYPAALPQKLQANELGLYSHEGQDILPLDGKYYPVKQDTVSGQHRVQHPTRPEAYQPVLEHNGAGTWKTELDQPLAWDRQRVLRRASAQAWPDETLEQIRTVAGVAEDTLRRSHAELEPPPALLADTLKRFKLYAEAGEAGPQLLADHVSDSLVDEVAGLLVDLPRWPEHRAVEVFDGPQRQGKSSIIGNPDATAKTRIQLTREEFRSGRLPQRTLESLDEKEIHELLGHAMSSRKEVRIQALKDRLAAQAKRKHQQLFESLYKQHEVTSDSQQRLLTAAYPELPSALAARLLEEATPADLKHLAQKKTIPLRLRDQVHQAQKRLRVSRAYEGLYLEALENNDTRRLQLASLAALPGWSNEVRIEIREFSFTGKLHASVGPENATIRKVLLLDEDGSYQARDERDQHLHGSDDFFASLLHALPDNERKALGYDIFDGQRLKADVQRSPLDTGRLAAVLDEHPLRKPTYDPQTMKLRGGMQGFRQLAGESLHHQRIRSLYPAFTDAQVGALLAGFGDDAAARIFALEAEFNQLNSTLQRWMNSPTVAFRFGPAGVAEWQSRNLLYKAIRQCWQRTGPPGIEVPGITGAQHLNLDRLAMSRHLANFPRLTANFDHVTSMSMRDASLLSGQGQFLKSFGQLRLLDLGANTLNTLPPAIGELRHLTSLMLDNNHMVLSEAAVTQLRGLKRLELLTLQGNPLGRVPDISQMPNLALLNLEATGIEQWPVGLFGKSRPRHLYLNLRSNHLNSIPDVAPGSFRAELLARTIVSREPDWMPASVLEKLKRYTESVGLDPERPYPPRGLLDSLKWAQGMPESVFKERLILWDNLEDEFGSEPFFNEIRKLTQSKDFNAVQSSYRSELTAKVWRMVEAMEKNPDLRERIFAEAAVNTHCADGGTQLFNALGLEVLIHEAEELQESQLVETELVELARGKSRLDELGAIARARVAERVAAGEAFRREDANGDVTGTIDEVEVHLAYMTDLAQSLDLPWQSRGMLFRNMAGVTPQMIADARLRVLELEKGDLLVDRILEQPFWQTHLEKTYRAELDGEFLRLQDEDEMTQFTAIQTLQKTLTRRAIEQAKLQRTELPFTVASAD